MSTPKNELRAKADQYSRLGWSVIPIKHRTKKPALPSWKPFAAKMPTEAEIEKWFRDGGVGVAVCLGAVSGNLVCRDFDDLDAYLRWAETHEDLANSLPISETSRGFHVFFRAPKGAVELISRTGSSIVNYDDGELRGGGIAVLPPSVHESGHVYRWLIEPGEYVPLVEDLEEAGLAQAWPSEDAPSSEAERFTYEDKDHQGELKTTDDSQSRGSRSAAEKEAEEIDLALFADEIADAIAKTQPQGKGKRNRCLFELARRLKAIGPLAKANPLILEDVVRKWHEKARAVIATQSFEESLCDFLRGWDKVKFPSGNSMSQLFNEALAEPLPKCGEKFSPEVRQLVALCRRLHRAWAPHPFPLACRAAGKLLDVSHLTASLWLDLLVRCGVLELVSKGRHHGKDGKGQASKYRYLGD